MAVEEPKFSSVVKDGDFELREYAAFIVAETWVEGDMDTASSQGFRAIADYIFGNNQVASGGGNTKIAMTAPVTVEPVSRSEKIAMTAPVTLEPASPLNTMANAKRWRVHFVMPSQYTLATLPKPKSDLVTIREVPAQSVAVATYSGFNTQSRIEQETQRLMVWMKGRGYEPAGPARLARYDPPWTLPIWRRNEIHIEILAR